MKTPHRLRDRLPAEDLYARKVALGIDANRPVAKRPAAADALNRVPGRRGGKAGAEGTWR